MDASCISLTMDDYSGFEMDRVVYSVLAVKLGHDPTSSVQILSFWIWLESLGLKDFVKKIVYMSHDFINDLAAEAITCLKRLRNPENMVLGESTELTCTSEFVNRKISLVILLGNREVVLKGINRAIDVCGFVLQDAIKDAVKKHASRDLLNRMTTLPSAIEESLIHKFSDLGFGGGSNSSTNSNVFVGIPPCYPRFLNSMHRGETSRGGIFNVLRQSVHPMICRSVNLGYLGGSGLPRNGGFNFRTSALPPEERSMFVTFSKGFPVTEVELLDFFNRMFGDCVESFHMQQVLAGEQALYARVVFRLPFVIDLVLKGLPKAKFTINGKHIWMRRFVPRLATS